MIARRGSGEGDMPAPRMGGALEDGLRALLAVDGPAPGGEPPATAEATEAGDAAGTAAPSTPAEAQAPRGGAAAAGGDQGVARGDIPLAGLGDPGVLDGLAAGKGRTIEEAVSRAESVVAGVESAAAGVEPVFSGGLPAGLADLGSEQGAGGGAGAGPGPSEAPPSGVTDLGSEKGAAGGTIAGPSELPASTGSADAGTEPAGPAGCGCEDCAECAGGGGPGVIARKTKAGGITPVRGPPRIQRGLLDDIGEAASSAASAVGGAASSAASAVSGAASSAASAVGGAVGSAVSAVGDAASSVLPGGLVEMISGLAGAARSRIGSLTGLEQQATGAQGQIQQQGQQARQEAEHQVQRGREQSGQAESQARETATHVEQQTQEKRGQAETAAGRMSGIGGGLVGPALDPGGGLVAPPAARELGQRLAGVAQGLPGEAARAAGADDLAAAVRDGQKAGPTENWDCTASEVMRMVSNLGEGMGRRAESIGKRILGEEGYARLMAFGGQVSQGVRNAAAAVRRTAGEIAGRVRAWWQRTTGPIAERARQARERLGKVWKGITQGVRGWVDRRWGELSRDWDRIKTAVVPKLEAAVKGVKDFVGGTVERARAAAGRFWDMLPGPVKSIVTGVGVAVVGPAALVMEGARRLGQYVSDHKGQILGALRAAGDRFMQDVARAWNGAKEVLSAVWTKVREWGSQIGSAIRDNARALYAAADEATGGWLTKIRDAVGAKGPSIRDDVCAILGEATGPCIRSALPKHGDFAEASLSGDLTVPIEGVPVKLAAGAKVNIAGDTSGAGPGANRPSAASYTATISGEGSLSITAPTGGGGGGGGGGGKVGVSVDLPQGGKAQLWERLTGGPAPAAPAAGQPAAPQGTPGGPGATTPSAQPGTTGPTSPLANTQAGPGQKPGTSPLANTQAGPAARPGAPAQQPGAPAQQPSQQAAPSGGPEVSAEGGLKGSAEAVYTFTADAKDQASCRGLGGLSTLLVAAGATAATSQLPPPFSLGGGSGDLSMSSFADQLTSMKMTFAQFGGLSVDLKQEGIGNLKFAAGAERGITIESGKEDTGEASISATIFTSLSGSLGGELGVGPLSGIGGSIGGGGRLFASLKYIPSKDTIKTIDAGAAITASVSLNNVQNLIGALPGPVAAEARQALQPYLGAHGNASVEGSATFKVSNLQQLVVELDGYFANPDAVTLDGVYQRVSRHLANNNELKIKVELTARSRLLGISVSASESGGVGGSVSASLDSGQKITLVDRTFTNLRLAA
jgi:hypothetical protein